MVGNAGLVKKVRFPLSVLPLTPVGFAGVHLVLQLLVLFVVMAITGYDGPFDADLLLLAPALFVALVFAVAMSFLVAALNVRYRDTQHIVEVALMAGFWVNPIVYSVSLVRDKLGDGLLFDLYFLNPVAGDRDHDAARALRPEPDAARRALGARRPTATASTCSGSGIGLAVSLVLLAIGWRVYERLSADFAEDL